MSLLKLRVEFTQAFFAVMFVHHGLPWMGKKKTVEMGRYYGSEALRDPKLQEKSYR